MKYYIGIDNGVTGSVCVLDENGKCMEFWATPVFKSLNYTKAVGYSSRVKGDVLKIRLEPYVEGATVVIERPMINPMRWVPSVSAVRADEATRIVLEMLGAKYIYVDSKEWQKSMLPKRSSVPRLMKDALPWEKKENKAKKAAFALETKRLSLAIGKQLFPGLTFKKDADAALMAEWARREKL
jgi:hypothetical protein